MSTPHSARRAQQRQRQRIARADHQRTGPVGGRGQRLEVLDRAEEVRLRHDDGADVLVELRQLGEAMLEWRLDDVHLPAVGERPQRLTRVRVHAARDHEPAAPVGQLGDVAGGGDRARALVDRRVGDRQAGQLADRGLVLEHRLQTALRDLGLVGRVGRQELRAARDRVDQCRHVVVVHARAQERDLVLGARVARGERAELIVDLLLGQPGVERQRVAEQQTGGNVAEQVLDPLNPDRGEHLGAVGVGGGGVLAHNSVAS